MNQQNDEVVIDLREIFGILRRRWRCIAGTTVLFTAAAVAYVLIVTPMYESTMLLQVKEPKNLKSDMLSLGVDDISSSRFNKDHVQQRVGTYKAVILSKSVVMPLIEEYGEKDKDGKLSNADSFIKNRIKVTSERNSDVLKVAVTAKSPEVAREMNSKLLSGINKQFTKMIVDVQRDTEAMLNKRVEEGSKKLQEIRAQRDDRYHASGDVSPVTEADRVVKLVSDMHQKQKENRLALRKVRISLAEVEEQLKNLPEAEITNDSIRNITKWLTELEFERSVAAAEKPDSKQVEVFDRKIASVRKQIKEGRERILAGLDASSGGRYTTLFNKRYDLTQEIIRRQHDDEYWTSVIAEHETKIQSLLAQKREYEKIGEQEVIIKGLHDMAIEKLNQIRTAVNAETGYLAVIEEPTYNDAPVAPRKVRITAIAMALGFILGSMYAVLKGKQLV